MLVKPDTTFLLCITDPFKDRNDKWERNGNVPNACLFEKSSLHRVSSANNAKLFACICKGIYALRKIVKLPNIPKINVGRLI